MSDIFLSYSHRDMDDMERVRDTLRAGGLAVWTDENLTPGSRNWQNAVQGAIYGAHALAVILTPISQRAVWVEREITMADENGVPIYPIVARGESRYTIGMRVREQLGGWPANKRAQRIARTEVSAALNTGQQIQAEQLAAHGLATRKVWDSVGDADVRGPG